MAAPRTDSRIPASALAGVLFDVDGVLVDSWVPHERSWAMLAEETGVAFTAADFARTFGRRSREILIEYWPRQVHADDGTPDEAAIRALDDRKEALYRALVADDFPAIPGAAALLDDLERAGIPFAAASSGPPENVHLVLDRLGGRDRFAAVVTGRDVTRGKPDPQVFVQAAAGLGVPAAACVVVEDAPDGIRAGLAAGARVLAVASTGRDAGELSALGAFRVVASLAEVDAAALAAAFASG